MTAVYAAGFQPQYDSITILTGDKIFHIALDIPASEKVFQNRRRSRVYTDDNTGKS